jgi:hypothetical protein
LLLLDLLLLLLLPPLPLLLPSLLLLLLDAESKPLKDCCVCVLQLHIGVPCTQPIGVAESSSMRGFGS